MIKHKNEKQIRKYYQKHLAKMVHSFLMQALQMEDKEVKDLYASFCRNWIETVNKINRRYSAILLNHDAWEDIWKVGGYESILTKPMLPEQKAALLRVIYIVEGKTEGQRQRRETKYKILFLIMRVRLFFRKLFKKK